DPIRLTARLTSEVIPDMTREAAELMTPPSAPTNELMADRARPGSVARNDTDVLTRFTTQLRTVLYRFAKKLPTLLTRLVTTATVRAYSVSQLDTKFVTKPTTAEMTEVTALMIVRMAATNRLMIGTT